MRRPILILLVLSMFFPGSAAADSLSCSTSSPSVNEQVPYPWIARWFVDKVAEWAVGRVLDYGVDRVRLSQVGHEAADHVSKLRTGGRLTSADVATLHEAELTIRAVAGTLARGEIPDAEARRRIAALEQDLVGRFARLSQRLGEIEQRIHTLERQQREQLRILVQLNGQVVVLGNRLYDLEGQFVELATAVNTLGTKLSGIDTRVENLEDVVYQDSNRYKRFGSYFSIYGLYADATAMEGDASLGIGASVQANLSKRIGVYGEAILLPIKATDSAAPDGSPLEWLTFPVVFGLAFDFLPPQSPLSVQLSGGGGISYSSLRYYPEDYDPELGNWEDVADVTSLVGTAKIEIGAAPLLSEFQPVLTIGYLGFKNPMNYRGGELSSNAGQELFYLSLGGRLRTNLPGQQGKAGR